MGTLVSLSIRASNTNSAQPTYGGSHSYMFFDIKNIIWVTLYVNLSNYYYCYYKRQK